MAKKTKVNKVGWDDAEEELLLTALEKGSLKSARNAKKEMEVARAAGANYLRKNARVNIRLSEGDLLAIRQRAISEGLPYQTLISSVVHKYVTGQLS